MTLGSQRSAIVRLVLEVRQARRDRMRYWAGRSGRSIRVAAFDTVRGEPIRPISAGVGRNVRAFVGCRGVRVSSAARSIG